MYVHPKIGEMPSPVSVIFQEFHPLQNNESVFEEYFNFLCMVFEHNIFELKITMDVNLYIIFTNFHFFFDFQTLWFDVRFA